MTSVRAIGFFSAALAASVAAAQSERVFHLTQNQTSQQMQEIVTTVRATADIRQISMDAEQRTVSLAGTAGQIETAVWLLKELDRPAPPAGPQVYRPSAGADDVVRVFFLGNASTVQQMQEVAVNLRSVVDLPRVFIYNTLRAVAVRGSQSRVDLAAWLVNQFDQPVGTPSPAPHEYKLASNDITRVFNLTYPQTPQQTQEIVTTLRSIGDIQRIFIYNARKTIAMRGKAEQIALAEWIVKLLDRPEPAPGKNEYRLASGPDNMVRVFYLTQSKTAQDNMKVCTEIRATARIPRLFVYNNLSAVAVRGTVGQVATAEKIIEEMGQLR